MTAIRLILLSGKTQETKLIFLRELWSHNAEQGHSGKGLAFLVSNIIAVTERVFLDLS